MSDADLRELERKWRETGSAADLDAWLQARVRVGDLDQRSLELTVFLSQEVGAVEGEPWVRKLSEWWVNKASRWTDQVCVRAVVAAGRAVEEGHGTLAFRELTARALEAAESWVMAPSERAERHAVKRGLRARPQAHESIPAAQVACKAGLSAGNDHIERGPHALRGLLWAIDAAGTELIAGAIQSELVPWALGYGDPVRERVEARQRTDAAGE